MVVYICYCWNVMRFVSWCNLTPSILTLVDLLWLFRLALNLYSELFSGKCTVKVVPGRSWPHYSSNITSPNYFSYFNRLQHLKKTKTHNGIDQANKYSKQWDTIFATKVKALLFLPLSPPQAHTHTARTHTCTETWQCQRCFDDFFSKIVTLSQRTTTWYCSLAS